METMAQNIYPASFRSLEKMVQDIEAGAMGQATDQLQALLAGLQAEPLENPELVQRLFFLEGLRNRLDPTAKDVGNLYLTPDDEGRQIKAFGLMAEKFPLVRFSQEMINSAILAAFETESEMTILDIGIGMGQQIVRLLEQALSRQLPWRKIRIIGIEPAEASLKQAQESLSAWGREHRVELVFEGIQQSAEDLDDAQWRWLAQRLEPEQGHLLINCSFALHHIRPVSLRTTLFKRLKGFSPTLLTLIEPYADFLTPNFSARFTHAWHHYGLVFHAIDQIDANAEDKSRIKRLFFSPEIRDVLSEEQHRVEQFETGEMWISRLEEAGFETVPVESAPAAIPNCSFVRIVRHPQYLSMDVAGYPILSIIVAQ